MVATRSRFYPDTERVMGWDIGGSGFRIVLAASVADVVERYLGDDVEDFLAEHDLKTEDVDPGSRHPGGPKVLDALSRAALELARDALDVTLALASPRSATSRRRPCCTCSRDTLAEPPPEPGDARRADGDGPRLLRRAGAAALVSAMTR